MYIMVTSIILEVGDDAFLNYQVTYFLLEGLGG